jgi:hypothetical protein
MAPCHICFEVISSLILPRETPAVEWVVGATRRCRSHLYRDVQQEGVESSPRQERVNVALVATAVLATDKVVKAVGT